MKYIIIVYFNFKFAIMSWHVFDQLNDRLKGIKMKEQNLKRKVLLNADVVFCCLGTCGRAELRAM